MEKNTRKSAAPKKLVSPKFFSVHRPDGAKRPAPATPGITIQIRLKNPGTVDRSRLLTRKNTEFWLSATD